MIDRPNPENNRAHELMRFGCTLPELKEALADYQDYELGDPLLFAMSILSDAQEELANHASHPTTWERARQFINRAKWVIATERKRTKEGN